VHRRSITSSDNEDYSKMVEWSMISVILAAVAILYSLSSPVVQFVLKELFLSIRNTLWPAGTLCRRLRKKDVSVNSPLHICERWSHEGYPTYAHANVIATRPPICERSMPSTFFALNPKVPESFADKPSCLDYSTTYIRMDMWTLGAYLLHWHDQLHWPDQITQPRVDIRTEGKILVAVVTANPQNPPLDYWPTICHLTINDVDGILRGYPPFYRETLSTIGGKFVRHPIRDVLDVPRGGWIAAIGLCRSFIVGKHCMSTPALGPEESLAPLLYVIRPFKRILEVLDHFLKAFPNQGFVRRVHTMAQEIRTHKRSTTSRSHRWFYDSDVLAEFGGIAVESREYLKILTADQCQTALHVFNRATSPTIEELKLLKPVLNRVLVAVLHGMHKAAEWDEKAAIMDRLNRPELDALERAVYVTERYSEEDN
jgi:hypothetical protein